MADVPREHHVSVDYLQNAIMNALLHPLVADPGTPADFQIWGNSNENRLKVKVPGGIESLAWLSDVTAGGLTAGLFDANTILKADTDDTPVALTVPEDALVGRESGGNIASLNATQVRAILSIPAGNVATETFVNTAIANLVDSSPGTLDTLNELAAALGDDPNFATSVNTAFANRLQAFSQLLGAAAQTAVTHGFTREVHAEVYREAHGEQIDLGISVGAPGSTTVTLDFATAPAANEFRVIVHGKP